MRVSSNAKVLPHAVAPSDALAVLAAMRAADGHRFLANDVSLLDADVPAVHGHRQVTDAVLITVAHRSGTRLVTFDRGVAELAPERVELLVA